MAVKELSFEWMCDWCGADYVSASGVDLPLGWIKIEEGVLRKLELSHVCTQSCWESAQAADLLAYELSNHVVLMVRRYWRSAEGCDIPEASQVEVQFLVGGEVIDEEDCG